jgi:hypothetical protein
MSLFSVNCRGAGNASTVRELRDFVIKFSPSIFCILETQISKARAESLAGTLGYDRAYAVGSSGRSGGLCLFWNNEIKVDILGYSQYHIDASIQGIGDSTWRLTSVYGEAKTQERFKTWDMLKDISTTSMLPWLCIGDFNEVLRPDEHEGIGHRSQAQIQGFRDAVDICELIDLGFKGHFWTWEKK